MTLLLKRLGLVALCIVFIVPVCVIVLAGEILDAHDDRVEDFFS